MFFSGPLVGHEKVDSSRVPNSHGVHFYSFFLQEFRDGSWIDPHVGFAVGYEDDVFVAGSPGERFGSKKQSFSDVGSRKSRNFLSNRIGRNLRKNCGKRFQIGGERRKKKGFSRKNDESKTVSVALRDKLRDDLFRHVDAIGHEVFREHRF